MNFLSHFYLHRNDDSCFNVGLTLPDILSLHNGRFRVTERLILTKKDAFKGKKAASLFDGMLIHLKVDNFFHNSDFFNKSLSFLADKLNNSEVDFKIPFYILHILFEILIDKYLLTKRPSLAEEFYENHKLFNFAEITVFFKDSNNFNEEEFLKFCELLSKSVFLKEYGRNNKIIESLNRISKRIGRPLELDCENKLLLSYIDESYSGLLSEIENFIDFAFINSIF
ncbi:MAG TPA: hypothetical protein PLO89_01080 [Spirochaetota bacterium]|nr:hypothetical protein [Spirochaetota bacterium]